MTDTLPDTLPDSSTTAISRPESLAPHSVEAEEAVLGSILLNPDALFDVAAILQPNDFFIVRNKFVYEAIIAIHERGDAIDNLTVTHELRSQGNLDSIGGSAYLTYLINNTPTHIHAEVYGRMVERASVRRRLLNAASSIAQIALEENAEISDVIDHAESALFGVTEHGPRRDLISLRTAVSEYFDSVEYLYNHPNEQLGVPTGFTELDKLLGGLQKSDLVIVAARPGVGKTSFMLSIAKNAASRAGKPTSIAVFSMEMSTEQLVQRLIAAETNINSQKLRAGNLDEHEWGKFVEATGRLGNLRMYLDDTPAISVPQMRTKSRRLYREHGVDLIIVDYLQLMTAGTGGRSDNRVQEISTISRGLKELARELNVPVLAAAQLSRAVEQRQDKRPMLSDLRESGCLAGDTLVYRPDTGQFVPIRDLAGQTGLQALSLNAETWQLEQAAVTNAFCTGVKPVFKLKTQLGRSIRATANHRFLTFGGWKRLDELTADDCIATYDVMADQAIPAVNASSHSHLYDSQREGTLTAQSQPALAQSDVYWDKIDSIVPDGETDVYDLTVPGPSNFVANNIVVHNSIEQDADVVMFIYRDELYDEATERPGQADILVSKHRNGPTGVITLAFKKEVTQFQNPTRISIDLRSM